MVLKGSARMCAFVFLMKLLRLMWSRVELSPGGDVSRTRRRIHQELPANGPATIELRVIHRIIDFSGLLSLLPDPREVWRPLLLVSVDVRAHGQYFLGSAFGGFSLLAPIVPSRRSLFWRVFSFWVAEHGRHPTRRLFHPASYIWSLRVVSRAARDAVWKRGEVALLSPEGSHKRSASVY